MGIHKPDGTLTWIDVEARPLGISRESAVFVTFVDISGMRATEAAMAAELRRSEVLASLSPRRYWSWMPICASRPCPATRSA